MNIKQLRAWHEKQIAMAQAKLDAITVIEGESFWQRWFGKHTLEQSMAQADRKHVHERYLQFHRDCIQAIDKSFVLAGHIQFVEGVQTQNFARDEDELALIKRISDADKRIGNVTYEPVYKIIDPKCTLPPPGWYCTREAGHEGPCAAWKEGHYDGRITF